jgi:hypothetical protein
LPADCEHGADSHDGSQPSHASAPEASRAWLLIEHPGPWPAEPAEAQFPVLLGQFVEEAAARGIRIQLIRRPARRREGLGADRPRAVFACWTAGDGPWLRRGEMPVDAVPGAGLDLDALASGEPSAFGVPAAGPMFLVCAHSRRNACCARFGGPLAQTLAARYPSQVWETTHVGGHRFAANLVILPHGLYYGPVDATTAVAALEAYEQGLVVPARYRGRAGLPRDIQESEHARLELAGTLAVAALA